MNSAAQMMMGRCIAGLGIGNLSVGVPMFQSESSPREIRGAVVASYQLMITIGILVANIVNYAVSGWESNSTSWRMVILTGMCLSLPLGIGIIYVPESPRWLAAGGDWESARTSLARLRGKQDDPKHSVVEADLDEMKRILEKEKQIGQGSWAECFSAASSTPKVLYRTLLGMAIHFLQQWTGINFFFYFGANIFSSTGIQDPLLTQIILGAVNVVMTLYGLYIVERFGRRQPLVIGAVWQAIWLLIFAVIGTLRDRSSRGTKLSGILMIISACMFIGSFAATWGPMAWVVVGETFPLRTRAKQASLATAGNWFGNFLIGFLTPIATRSIGYSFGFVFCGTNFVAALIVWFFLYESRTLSLENVDLMYGDKELNAWTSSEWVPPGYISRRERAGQTTASARDELKKKSDKATA